ncbi:MAG: hypothetical protein A2087_11295 [Spirochaetes bacterium GWD1_61_31]|nr:MAG: hypothetical protein A2Y37_01295 [Spirochaetes bacterium GWB1_60_80]OHD33554.1 MAG: hypothetical protein A2004_06595 [Spirochaetes bacterium GWC1_61_12]OHD35702.1 MAG: hypothetical protein A2087_11295 [Spirochaetes bacterium GWD1_61_31]OHD41839.1 MAG: hypothetical protein A2Y35_04390 [Spirochaetes bacterium GWE1_60_18]OHD57819.1 MAG: hypothetical protein A2Y32_14085 [Spirochaetes bacterium GWF1_60_12]
MTNLIIPRRAPARLGLFLLTLLAVLAFACDSDLLSAPPDTITVSLTAAPTVTPTYAGAQISFSTDTAATVSVEYGSTSGALTLSVPRSADAATTHTVNLTGLAAASVYYYRVVAYLGSARAFPGAEYSFTTAAHPSAGLAMDGAPAVTPFDTIATVDFDTTLSATYSLEYGTVSGTYTKATPLSATAALAHSVELTGLTASTTYYYRLRLYYNGEFATNSAQYSFLTNTNPSVLALASGPTEVAALTTLQLSWDSNFDCTHLVEYGTVSGTYTMSTVKSITPQTLNHSVTLSGLDPATTYYYRIQLFWNSGDDLVSAEYSEATLTEAAPTVAQKARGVWLLGGLPGSSIGSPIGPVDLYDPVTDTWYAGVTDIPAPVSFAGYAAASGKLFVIGGFDASGVASSGVQIYDIAGDSWSTGTSMLLARANINATVSNGKIYVMGGTAGTATTAWAGSVTNYEYNIAGDAWNTRTNFGASGSGRFSFALDDVIYNAGGRTAATTSSATHDAFVPANNAVSTVALETALSLGRTGLFGAAYAPPDGASFVILAGGVSTFTGTPACFINQGPTAGAVQNLIQFLAAPFYAPSAWTIPTAGTTTLPASIAFGAAVISTAFTPARFYIFGGTSLLGASAAGSSSVYWCDLPTPPTWSVAWTGSAAMAGSTVRLRWGHGAVTLNQ